MTHAAHVARLHGDIATFYDRTSGLWEEQWGVHMHHGFYGPSGDQPKNHQQAQVDLIEELLRFAGVQSSRRVLDVGCGIGGSTLYLAKRFGAAAQGVTLSPVQVERAERRAAAAGLRDVRFQIGDAMRLPFAEGSFDLVWSLEVGEHIADRRRFLAECARVLEPGGRLVVVAWCHRPEPPALSFADQRLLGLISRAYHLPAWSSLDDYRAAAEEAELASVRTDDWSASVSPFWPAVARAAVRPRGLLGLSRAGWPAIRGALTMSLMMLGSRRKLIRYGVMAAEKPSGRIDTEPAA